MVRNELCSVYLVIPWYVPTRGIPLPEAEKKCHTLALRTVGLLHYTLDCSSPPYQSPALTRSRIPKEPLLFVLPRDQDQRTCRNAWVYCVKLD
jgi:hypothetical protein